MLFILLLALILFGPKRLPEIARQIGKFVAEFKRASNDFKYQLQAEIDKATPSAPAAPQQSAQQSSPSTPALSPGTPETGALGTAMLPSAEDSPAPPPAESEHERLMRTARKAYEAQTFTLRPPEPPPVAHMAPSAAEQAEPVTVPSTANPAPAGDSQLQSAKSGQIGGPAPQGN